MQFIEIRDLRKVYNGATRALNGVNLDLREGEWTTIMGPSGSGKTTLLNLMGLLDSSTSGSINVMGNAVTNLTGKARTRFRRENYGFIFQQFHLIPYLTAIENVMLSQYFRGTTDRSAAEKVLERVGLKNRMDHTPPKLSGGEQQRVAVARALINNPSILFADEPTGNLDQENGQQVLVLLQELHDDGHTIVMITHDRTIAGRGDRIVTLVDGVVTGEVTS